MYSYYCTHTVLILYSYYCTHRRSTSSTSPSIHRKHLIEEENDDGIMDDPAEDGCCDR
jgi:hypothetical protein